MTAKNHVVKTSAKFTSLEKRLSHQLEVPFISNGANTPLNKTILQETLEVVINSNLINNMLFQVFGDEKLIELTTELLWFLGIKENPFNFITIKK
ncbi:MAG: hypothetical protein WCP85_25355 [Mariniphaga sp.]